MQNDTVLSAGLTRQQRDLMIFIRSYVYNYGYSPSYQDMMEHMDLRSKSGIHRIVHALAEKGYIRFLRGRARSIIVADQTNASVADAIALVLCEVSLSTRARAELQAILNAGQT